MSFGRKSSEPKVERAESAFKGTRQSNVTFGDLITANSQKAGGGINTNVSSAGQLVPIQSKALQGIQNQQGVLNQSLGNQLSDIQSGKNPYFNLQSELNRKNFESALSDASQRFALSGLDNSTARGAFEAQLASDAILNDLATRQSAIEFQNNLAGQNLQLNQNVLRDIVGAQQFAAGTANNNLMTALADISNTNRVNAQMQNAANNIAYQQELSRPSFGQSLLNIGTSLGGAALGGAFGNPAIGNSLGSVLGRVVNRPPNPVTAFSQIAVNPRSVSAPLFAGSNFLGKAFGAAA